MKNETFSESVTCWAIVMNTPNQLFGKKKVHGLSWHSVGWKQPKRMNAEMLKETNPMCPNCTHLTFWASCQIYICGLSESQGRIHFISYLRMASYWAGVTYWELNMVVIFWLLPMVGRAIGMRLYLKGECILMIWVAWLSMRQSKHIEKVYWRTKFNDCSRSSSYVR